MTTGGEGGMVTTNDRELWSRMWSYKDHGKSWEAVYEREHPPGFRWLHESFGTNWRMMEMQAAIGRIQLKRMSDWHERRKANAEAILEVCRQFPVALRVPVVPDDIEHAWYKCYLFVRPEGLREGWSRERIMEEINVGGVPCYAGTCSEVYLEKAFDGTEYRPKERLPVAKALGETSLMFLVHPTLSVDEIKKTREVVSAVMGRAS
jgi:dTDP-4-amino-4,6-dideoxygalactose transaminase